MSCRQASIPAFILLRSRHIGRYPFSEVALVGGHLYLDVMRHLVDLFRIRGFVVRDVRITEINGAIGLMRRDLRRWLDGRTGEEG